jgi:hypothetical protein
LNFLEYLRPILAWFFRSPDISDVDHRFHDSER